MRYKMVFIIGLGVGFVLGARAGRERYEQLVKSARKAADSPAVQQAAGAIQAQATGLAKTAKDKVTDQAPKIAGAARSKVGSTVGKARSKARSGKQDDGTGAGGANGRPAADGYYTSTPGASGGTPG
jgi:hypothetical protein